MTSTLIYVDITNECNYGCTYCNAPYKYSAGNISNALKISHLFKLKTIEYDHNNVKFIITGGEPSIYGLKYNQDIIKAIRCLHKVHVPIEYVSNLSQPVEFYSNLDVDCFVFSYHPAQVSYTEFINKFEEVSKIKHSLIRVHDQSEFNYKPECVVGYKLNGINDRNLLQEYSADRVFEITALAGTVTEINENYVCL